MWGYCRVQDLKFRVEGLGMYLKSLEAVGLLDLDSSGLQGWQGIKSSSLEVFGLWVGLRFKV